MAKRAGSKTPAAKPAATAPSAVTETQGAAVPATPPTPQQAPGAAAGAPLGDLDELSQLRQRLAEETQLRITAERGKTAAENRLTMLVEADADILAAERTARQMEEELERASEVQKKAKKAYDAAVDDLRKKVRDRMEGRPSLFDAKETAAARGVPQPSAGDVATAAAPTNGKPKKTKEPAPATGGATAASATTASDAVEDDKQTTPVPKDTEAPDDWWLNTSLGSVSVKGDQPGEMLSLPPAMVKACGDAGVTSVAQAKDALDNGQTIKGVGDTGKKKLRAIIEKWIAAESEGGNDPKPAKAGPDAATHRLCGSCQHRWELPTAVVVCPQCSDAEYLFDVGFHGNKNADEDGDLVASQEVLPFKVPASAAMAGMDQYQFRVILAPDGDGQFVPGFEIAFDDDVSESYYPNVAHAKLSREAAIEQGLWLLREAVRGLLPKQEQQTAWDAAAVEAIGRQPVKHADPVAAV